MHDKILTALRARGRLSAAAACVHSNAGATLEGTVSMKGDNAAEDVGRGNMAGCPYQGVQLECGGPARTTTQQLRQQAHTADSGTKQQDKPRNRPSPVHMSPSEASHDS